MLVGCMAGQGPASLPLPQHRPLLGLQSPLRLQPRLMLGLSRGNCIPLKPRVSKAVPLGSSAAGGAEGVPGLTVESSAALK